MQIKALKYTRYIGTNKEWKLVGKDQNENEDYIHFGILNLLVSTNGGGKSRTLEVIRELSELISGVKKLQDSIYSSQIFDFIFIHNEQEYFYFLDIRDREVYKESLTIAGDLIYDTSKKFLSDSSKFLHIDSKQLLINQNHNGYYVTKELYAWSFFVKTFFSNQWVDLQENIKDVEIKDFVEINVDKPSFVTAVFAKAKEEFGESYVEQVLSYTNQLNFNFTDIELQKGKRGCRLYIEEDHKYYVEQSRLSQKVFRALSIFIILIYVKRKELSACILVDDIGDGFDNDNAKNFIDSIINLTYKTSIQFFMTSTNRLILNNIHLKNWTVLDRVDNKSIAYNIYNSETNFEDFKYTSLNNIDFFATDFYKYGFESDGQKEEDV